MYKWSKHVKPIQTLWPVAYTCLYNVSWVTIHLVFQASLLMSGLLEMAASASSPLSSSFDLSWAQYDQEVALAELSQPPFEGFQATKTAVVQRQPPKLSLKPSLDYRLCREGISKFHWIPQSFPQRKRRHPWCLRIITSDHRSCRELQGLPFSLKLLEDFEFFFQHLTMTQWHGGTDDVGGMVENQVKWISVTIHKSLRVQDACAIHSTRWDVDIRSKYLMFAFWIGDMIETCHTCQWYTCKHSAEIVNHPANSVFGNHPQAATGC